MEKSLKSPEEEKKKHLRREIRLILFFSFLVFIVLTLATFSPHDETLFTKQVFPGEKTNNFFGSFGANIAAILIQTLGFASYFIPLYLVAFILYSKMLKEFTLNTSRVIFFILSLFSLSALLSGMSAEDTLFGLRLPLGGFFGLVIAETLSTYLNNTGALFVSMLSFVVFTILALEKNIFKRLLYMIIEAAKKLSLLLTIKSKSIKPETRPPKVVKVVPRKEKEEKDKTVEPEIDLSKFIKPGKMSLPPISLLNINKDKYTGPSDAEIRENCQIIEECLRHFDIKVAISEVHPGPLITMYEIIPEQGTKINKIVSLEHELSMALKAISLRIIAPIPGKSTIGIEVSNKRLATVYIREIIGSEAFDNKNLKIPLCLGKNTTGDPYVTDLVKMPHLLVAGATGSGKSVSLNVMILSILYKMMPDEAKFIMIDPKMLELNFYSNIPHLLYPVVTSPEEAAKVLKWAIKEMERRYELMAGSSVRNIEQYNAKIAEKGQRGLFSDDGEQKSLPYIIIIIDELADLMMVSAKEVETYITRLAQKARAAGIHMIVATQRPSVDVITGLIKANFPARIAFKVASKIDSRTILDTNGADTLLGQGDMLFLRPGTSSLLRIHGAFVTEAEIEAVVNFWKAQGSPEYIELPADIDDEAELEQQDYDDDKYEEAVKIVRESRQASISYLQRRMRIGYNRAARLIERMEREGIVTPSEGGKPREVIF
ncbi:MAG: DNA translocase FtsK [bacterium]